MKKLSLFLSALLISMMSFATTYTHTFKSGELKVGTVTLSGTSWTGAGTVGYWGWDSSKGIQIGSKNNPCKSYSLTTSAFADATITEVVVNTSMASSATAKLSISVGGTSYLSNKALTTSAANYTATGAASGDLVISYTNTARAFYIKSITVTYEAKEIEGPKYTVTANVNNPTMGSVTGAGEYGEGATATLTAIPNPAYKFVDWSNGSTDNPLKITVTENIELTANFEALPTMTCAEASAAANGATVVLNPFDVVYAVKGAGYIYIKDESGVALIFDYTLDDQLKAGDRVEGFVGTSSPYNGLPEIKPSVAFEDLTVTSGAAPEPTLFAAAPTKTDVNKYVKFEGVTLSANTTFTTDGATNATMVVNGTNVTLRNAFKLAATLSKDKAYNIIGFVAIYNSSIQVYFLSAEEYVAPEPCTLATPVNWDAPIAAEANTDQWYAVNVASAIAAGKDLALTVTNPGTEAVEITIEAYADCPATELIVKSTKTFNAGETKTTTVKYDEYLADQVEVVYMHVTTEGGEINVEAETAKFNVTATAENGTVEGAGIYEQGAEATLTATAAEGYEFVNWTVDGAEVSTENPYSFVVTADVALVANFKEVEPEIEWLEMPLEITNLTTEVMEVEGAKYLLLQGRDDMNDADVMLFLNNYADVDDDYEVNAESSYMTFGGLELTVLEGVMTQTSETDKGTMYNGIVRTYVAEDSLYVAFNLTMYAAPATVLELTDAIVAINEDLGTLTFNVPTGEGEGYFVELSGYTAPGVHEGPQICLFETPEVVAYTNYAETSVADGVITLKGEFTSFMGAKFDLTISGKLPVVEEPEVEKPEPTYTENNLNPYAFGLESKLSDDKTTLTVTYRLNNSNATSVNVVIYNGEDIVASIPGTTTIGKNTVEVATGNLPAGVELKWAVEVNGTSVEAPTAETKIYSFYHPSGLDIDINPENETFGLLLVNEGMHSVKSKTEGYVSAQFGAGIFAFTPSFDLIPNGELPGYNGGIEFTTTRADGTGTAYSPRRIRISEDGRIFVTSLNTDGNYLWEVNADNLNEWTPVFKGTLNDQRELITEDSAFIAAPNNGFDVKGSGENLQLAMYSVNLSGITAAAMSGFRLHEYNLGTATEWTTAPSKALVEGKYAINYTGTQVEYDNEGGFWIASYRGTASDANPGLVHINADGVEDAKLVWNNVRQAGIRFNKDFTKLVVAGNNGAAKKATIYTISKDANGAPVLTQEAVVDMAAVGNNLNDFAWDYAGNLYACGNSSEKLAAWAMPYSGEVETPAASKYAFQLEGEAVEYTEIVMSNLVVTPYGEYDILEASDAMTGIAVMLGVDADGKLVEGSEVTWNGTSMTILSSGVFTKAYNDELATDVYNGKLVIEFYGEEMGLDLYMYGTGAAASVDVVVTDANIAVDEWGSYVVTANWGEGTLTCEVSDTEYEGFMMIEYTITEDDWYIWMAYSATVTTTGNVMTIEGEFTDNYTGTTYNVTISGTLTPTGVEDATVTVKPVKMIKNGQLIIEKDGVQYNANGAQL